MGRLRARLAKHEADKDLQTHVGEAMRVLGKALDSAQRAKTNTQRIARVDRSALDGLAMKRSEEAAAKIRQARRLLESIGFLYPNVDSMDPDLLPESLQEERSRERLAAIQEEREARRHRQE